MKIRFGKLKTLIRETMKNAASRLTPGSQVEYQNNMGITGGCTVVSTHPETNKVTLDVPHGTRLVRITIDADQIVSA